MKKYVCTVCNWVYDPAKGDPEGGIIPGTSFEEIDITNMETIEKSELGDLGWVKDRIYY